MIKSRITLSFIITLIVAAVLTVAVFSALADDTELTLKSAYDGAFLIGTAVSSGSGAFISQQGKALMAEQFNLMTLENEMKPNDVLDVATSKSRHEEDALYNPAVKLTNGAKEILNFAQQNGMVVHGHTLVWHGQTPDALFYEDYETSKALVGREEMLTRMENYIRNIFELVEGEYPGLVVSWDVVNEAMGDNSAMR